MIQKIFWLGLAGAIGTLTRYWLGGVVQKMTAGDFPLGTVVVNISGCLVFGILWGIFESRLSIGSQMRMIIFVGFFGAFTTFSSFIFETGQLVSESQWFWALGNILLQNTVGLICMIIGLAAGRLI
jgi:fluoride exporter